ncbi:unnamed protein product [[Candida] boidinii]|nr:unnamed protein product [[Candida] boidinii]
MVIYDVRDENMKMLVFGCNHCTVAVAVAVAADDDVVGVVVHVVVDDVDVVVDDVDVVVVVAADVDGDLYTQR